MVEDVLVPLVENTEFAVSFVLILVVVEDVLVLCSQECNKVCSQGLNPCCGGRCSSTSYYNRTWESFQCLNPCCGGRCSSTDFEEAGASVGKTVLILVVVEDVLVLVRQRIKGNGDWCLNPCCSGRCSSTVQKQLVTRRLQVS